ncbi:MAG: transketolase [Actinobacteria bacterium]|nr:transketolase [Actinomycetota bacterium]
MEKNAEELKKIADQIRIDTFKAIAEAGGGHFGGSLSIIEILTVLYFLEMQIDPLNPKDSSRDIFVLSKGHGGPALYATLARRGFFPYDELARTLDRPFSKFPKHIDRTKLESIELSTGPLGQGLSMACGIAISLKQQNKNNRVYVLISDGELNSGQTWEAAMLASKYKLDNVIAIIDWNKSQVDGPTGEVMPTDPLDSKWKAFGWQVFKTDGHSIGSIIAAIDSAKIRNSIPKVIIASTVKGFGVSFMENNAEWHSGKLDREQFELGLKQLQDRITCQ